MASDVKSLNKKQGNILGTITFDIGTSRSGFAYALSARPTEIITNQSTTGIIKDLTALLFNDKKEFIAFGESARQKYYELITEDQKTWAYYDCFKMKLYEKDFKSNVMVTAANGVSQMSYLELLTATIKHLDKMWTDQTSTYFNLFDHDNFQICITVPAMWSESAKFLMRQAAVNAGLKDSLIQIILESEAASIYCKTIDSENWKPNMRYAVFDLGGGTCDVTVHSVNDSGALVETIPSGGGPWGSTYLDREFEQFLCDLVGLDVISTFKKNKPGDYLEMCQAFETAKINFTSETNVSRIRVYSLLQYVEGDSTENKNTKFTEMVERFSGVPREGQMPRITFHDGKLLLSREFMLSFFNPLLEKILNYFKTQVKPNNPTLSHVYFVGGFSESKYLQQFIKAKFTEVKILIPPRPSLSVLQGGVQYGLNPGQITSRIAKATYGVAVTYHYDSAKHSGQQIVYRQNNGVQVPYVDSVFSQFCKINESINVNAEVKQNYTPGEDYQDCMIIRLYKSSSVPQFVTDPTCTLLGHIIVQMPWRREDGTGLKRQVRCSFFFGNTQIIVKAVDLTSLNECSTTLQFNNSEFDRIPKVCD